MLYTVLPGLCPTSIKIPLTPIVGHANDVMQVFRDQLKECTQRRSNSLDVKRLNRVMVVSGNVHTYGCSALSEGLAWQLV